MAALITIILVIIAVTASGIKPILLSPEWIDSIHYFIDPVMEWNGLLPITSWILDVILLFSLSMAMAAWKIMNGIFALFTGGGKPEL